MFSKKGFEFIDEFKYLGSAQEFEEAFYRHITKGEVGYNHIGFSDFRADKKLFIGNKTLDNKGNYRVRLNIKVSSPAKRIETYLEITPESDYLKIKAITRLVEVERSMLKFGLWYFLIVFAIIWIVLTIYGYWYAIIGLLPFVLALYFNIYLLKNGVAQLRTRFTEYFLTWENVQKIDK